jgi:hypothetical protein
MLDVRFKWLGFAALLTAGLTMPGSAASPDAGSSAETRAAAPTAASLFPELPEEGADSLLPNQQFNFLRGSSPGGAAAAGGSGVEPPSARVLDQLDRRRNWIYATQSPASFELSAQQALGVRSAEPADRNGEPESWLSEFFHDRGTQPSQNRTIDDLFSNSLQTSSSLSTLFNGMPQAVSGLGGSLGMAPFQSAPAEVSSSSLSAVTDSLGLRELGLSSVPISVREMLAYPASVNPLGTGYDPINMRADTTQEELNPTVTERLADLEIEPKSVDALLDRPIRGASSTRTSLPDSFNTRMTGGSSLTPAGLAPNSVGARERPLDFGRFPTRSF